MSRKKIIKDEIRIEEKILEFAVEGKLNWKKFGKNSFKATIKNVKKNMEQLKRGRLEVEIVRGDPDLYSMFI